MAVYFNEALDPALRTKVVNEAVEAIRKTGVKHIAVRGISGLAIGTIVAHLLGIRMLVVRKPGENSHCSDRVSGRIDATLRATNDEPVRYVILDDFIYMGGTVREIQAALQAEYKNAPFKIECVGFYGYADNWKNMRPLSRIRYCRQDGMDLTSLNDNDATLDVVAVDEHGFSRWHLRSDCIQMGDKWIHKDDCLQS